MWKLEDSIKNVKNAFSLALQSMPDFANLSALDKGKVVDASLKSMLTDLMSQLFFMMDKKFGVQLSKS